MAYGYRKPLELTKDLYKGSLSLLTDLYQLTMAYAYWKEGIADKEAVFNLFYRKNPFNGGYAITCGLSFVIDYIKQFRFNEDDLEFLGTLESKNGKTMFEPAFINYLSKLEFSCSIDAIPEGRVVFPHQPLLRVQGPIVQCQIIESALLNMINFQSLVATKAARISHAAKTESIMEFGLRRAQGIDGSLCASRAAFIGGCNATSNVLAGKLFGIPLAGTHAHSWVMAFDSEIESFRSYAKALPDNCIFLIDTYDTLEGVKNAIEVGKILESDGKSLLGVRIDSGDLSNLSKKVRALLDSNGFTKTKIVASNNLDEHLISSLEEQGSEIDTWGVGTKLVTAFGQPALGGVYKLSAIKNNGSWVHKLKLSEQTIKINHPGIQQVRRFTYKGALEADMIYEVDVTLDRTNIIVDHEDPTKRRKIDSNRFDYEDLLVPIFRSGVLVYDEPNIFSIKQKATKELEKLNPTIKRFMNPQRYFVGLEASLFDIKTQLVMDLRNTE